MYRYYGDTTLASNNTFTGIASWVWFQIAFVFLLIIPFIAYHRMRVRLQNVAEGRVKELHRLILQVSHEAGQAVLLHARGSGVEEELNKISTKYLETLKSLDIEAGIDGGEVKEAIQTFTGYVSFHVMRFLNWDGKIISDSETKKKIEIDEYHFIGSMANRADQTIEKVKKAFTR